MGISALCARSLRLRHGGEGARIVGSHRPSSRESSSKSASHTRVRKVAMTHNTRKAAHPLLSGIQLGEDVLEMAEVLRESFRAVPETGAVSEADFLVLSFMALDQTGSLE